MMNKKVWVGIAVILLAVYVDSGPAALSRQKAGKKPEVVENGKKPVSIKGLPSKIHFERELTVGESDDPEQAFSQLAGFAVMDDGRIFGLDMKEKKVKIYDKEGKFVRSFGKEGQGPGELSMPSGISVTPNGEIMIEDAMNRRLSYFSSEGEYLRQTSIADKTGLVNIHIGPEGNMLGREIVLDNNQMFFDIKKFDPELKPIFTIDRMEFPNPLQGKINLMEIISLYQFDSRGNAVYGRTDKYEIHFYDREGNRTRTIKKDYDPVRVTPEDVREMTARIPDTGINLKERLEFPDHFPAYSFFSLDEQDRIYVRTYEKGKKEDAYALEIFDKDGRFFAKTFCELTPMLWKGIRVYSIEENDDGYQVIRRYRAEWE